MVVFMILIILIMLMVLFLLVKMAFAIDNDLVVKGILAGLINKQTQNSVELFITRLWNRDKLIFRYPHYIVSEKNC